MASGAARTVAGATLALGALSPCAASAGAWLQPEGRGQVIFNPSVMVAGSRFDRTGRPWRTDRFVKQDNITLIEYGLRSNLTLLLNLTSRGEAYPIEGAVQRVYTSRLGGGTRLALWRGDNIVFSAQISVGSGLERSMPVLDRRFGVRHEADARLLAGFGFTLGQWPAFVEAQLGYRWRSGRFADEARLDLSFGVKPADRLQILLQAFNTVAVEGQGYPRERPRQHKLQLSALFDMTETWSVQAGFFTSVAGRQSLREQGILLGLWRKF
jgi:hypothetical protein